ncbi:MAG: hypothetical protein L3J43_10065 [Sulfurovum sp.]|nr:hypothetical protein [Sulfurovum sp.]
MAELSYVLKESSKYSECVESLKETSKDTNNNEYLCKSSMEVYDFDCIVKKLYPLKQPSSYDSLIIDEDKKMVYCIEFKNQIPSQINNANIKKKLTNGKEVLDNICTNENVQKKDYKFIYCVVHKPVHNRYGNPLVDRETKFELKVYKGTHFDEIVTNDINFFKNEFKKEFKKEGC